MKGINNVMEKKEFSVENTLELKGVAIIMMMFHHCFRKSTLFKDYTVSFFPLSQDFVVSVSLLFKICVSIFAFITGYGLMLSLKKLNSEYNWSKKEICKWVVNRLIKLLSGFMIVVVIAWIVCQIIDGNVWDTYFQDGIAYGIVQMIIELFGLSDIMGTASMNSTWWYMSIAVLFVISIPIFAKLFKKIGTAPTLLLVIFIPRIIGWEYHTSSYISFLFPVLLGMIFAERNLLVKFANFKIIKNHKGNKVVKFVLETIILIGLLYLYTKLPEDLFWEVRFGIIPVFLICYLYEFIIEIPVIKQILKFLGIYSMDIFLIHTFIRSYYLKDFIYSRGHFIVIVAVLLLSSLAISIVLELFKKLIRYNKGVKKLQNFVDKLIDKAYSKKSSDKALE